MDDSLVDYLGQEITEGCTIVYPTVSGHCISMNRAVVDKIKEGKGGKPFLNCGKNRWGTTIIVRRFDTVIVVG